MPSLSESRKQVDDQLRAGETAIDHDAVLASLQDEIDRHNSVKDDVKRLMRNSKRESTEQSQHHSAHSSRFRFKDGVQDPKLRRKHRSRHHDDGDRHCRRKRKRDHHSPPRDDETAHPFPREPTDPAIPDHNTDTSAFRDSLFDALADDEGAAYWESVYSQPIHVYARPTVQTEKGELEQMSDEQYTDYVKTKMWERKHPEIVLERERRARERKDEEEDKTRRREEFIRRKEQASWEKAQRRTFPSDSDDEKSGRDDRYGYEFAGEKAWSSAMSSGSRAQQREYEEAWAHYLATWDKLKHELLSERKDDEQSLSGPKIKPSKRIPWPVLTSKPIIKVNIEDFMRHAPADAERSMAQTLKAERVKWHPDKVQQRFGGEVDDGTMKIVTGVFQVVDGLLEEERKRW